MKKLLLLISITLISVATVNGQCIPDPQFTQPGVYPDSATGFANACVGMPYEQIVTNIVPVDTCAVIIAGLPCIPLDFDSVVITGFTGLPPGFTYTCNSPQNTTSPATGCTFEGGTIGCISIVGNPSAGDIGVYTLSIELDVYMAGGGTPQTTQTVDYYSIEVVNCTAGLGENTLANITAYPNPTDNILTVAGLSGSTETLTITDANGKLLKTMSNITTLSHAVNVRDLESGIYFVKINQDNNSKVIRFVKK